MSSNFFVVMSKAPSNVRQMQRELSATHPAHNVNILIFTRIFVEEFYEFSSQTKNVCTLIVVIILNALISFAVNKQ